MEQNQKSADVVECPVKRFVNGVLTVFASLDEYLSFMADLRQEQS